MLSEPNQLPRRIPEWAEEGYIYFLTLKSQPKGENSLCVGAVAEGLTASALQKHEKGEWWLQTFLVLPDRIHALITFAPDLSLQLSIANWKRFTDRKLKINWQRGFQEQTIRDEESLEATEQFLREAPIKAGLCENLADWPHYWTVDDL